VRVVATSSLPIDLAAQVRSKFPAARVEVPHDWIGVERCDLSDADALVCLLMDRIDAGVLARAPKLRVVANCAVGYNNVDVGALTAAGVAVTNTPDVLTEATAELAFALMLAAARRLPEGERLVRSGQWEGWRLDQLLGVQLLGKTLGIIGMGRIGQAMARRAVGFGMTVIYAGGAHGEHRRVELDDLFREADVISLHCPLTAETRHIVNARTLALVKPTAIIVNTARGECLDEAALVEAFAQRRIFGAGLDVFEGEPRVDARLRADPRLVLAPHIGSATTEARTSMAQLCADAVIAVLSGRRPGNLVNREVVLRG
jgi:glyoxylate reductase